MILEDLILIGRTVPEPSKKYGVTVCGICYSPELRRFIRIYPLIINSFKINRRGIFRACLKNPCHDPRSFSFKILEYWDTGKKACMMELKDIFEKSTDTIKGLNEKRKSIGVLKLNNFEIKMKRQKKVADDKQLLLFEEIMHKNFKTGRDYPIVPYVIAHDQEQNKIPLRDWQIFELMRRKGDKVNSKYLQNIFDGKETYFVIGNILQFQNRWLAVSSYSYKTHQQTSLFENII